MQCSRLLAACMERRRLGSLRWQLYRFARPTVPAQVLGLQYVTKLSAIVTCLCNSTGPGPEVYECHWQQRP